MATSSVIQSGQSQTPHRQPLVRPPVLVLGLGNRSMTDDGVGLLLCTQLEAAVPRCACWRNVEYLAGDQAAPSDLCDRDAILIFDSIEGGGQPGTFHVLEYDGWNSAHQSGLRASNAPALIAAAAQLGRDPARLMVAGIQPADLAAGSEVSAAVASALPDAIERSRAILRALLPSANRCATKRSQPPELQQLPG